MNPRLPSHVVERALAEDESAARAEYFAEFRRDVETFVPLEVVERAVVPARVELAPMQGENYFAFVDPSGAAPRASRSRSRTASMM